MPDAAPVVAPAPVPAPAPAPPPPASPAPAAAPPDGAKGAPNEPPKFDPAEFGLVHRAGADGKPGILAGPHHGITRHRSPAWSKVLLSVNHFHRPAWRPVCAGPVGRQ